MNTPVKTWIAANWKLNKNPRDAEVFLQAWGEQTASLKWDESKVGVLIFPSAVCLDAVSQAKAKSRPEATRFQFGPQNIYSELSGAYTGETSAQVAKDLGATFTLIGHSERRTLFSESDAFLAKKVALTQKLGLCPMLCIGENLAERESGSTQQVLKNQLREGLKLATPTAELAIAYEPVWAIGTGKVATLDQVAEAHAWIRRELNELGFTAGVSILYGGSVKGDNAAALAKVPDVNGFLVGGAALEVKTFLPILQAVI